MNGGEKYSLKIWSKPVCETRFLQASQIGHQICCPHVTRQHTQELHLSSYHIRLHYLSCLSPFPAPHSCNTQPPHSYQLECSQTRSNAQSNMAIHSSSVIATTRILTTHADVRSAAHGSVGMSTCASLATATLQQSRVLRQQQQLLPRLC